METNEQMDTARHNDEASVVRHRTESVVGTSELPVDAPQAMVSDIPPRHEEVDARKRPMIREHAVASHDLPERTQPTTETLRREELHIHGDYIDDELQDIRLERNRSGRSL